MLISQKLVKIKILGSSRYNINKQLKQHKNTSPAARSQPTVSTNTQAVQVTQSCITPSQTPAPQARALPFLVMSGLTTASPSELAAEAINAAQGWRKEERRCEYSTVGGEAVRTPQGWVHHGPLTPITEVIPV